MINFNELKGTQLKKDLAVDGAVKRYHNKHRNGSGNFGFTITKDNVFTVPPTTPEHLKECFASATFTMDGNYNTKGEITSLSFYNFGRSIGGDIPEDWTYAQAIEKMKEIIKLYIEGKKAGKFY